VTNDEAIYCTWSHRTELPDRLQLLFGDLDDCLRQLIAAAQTSLLIVAPYLSVGGFQLLASAMSVCLERSVAIKIVTQLQGQPAEANRMALTSLVERFKDEIAHSRYGIRILSARNDDLFIHAKIVVADSARGYIGSANFSARGLDRNLELGVPLSTPQAKSIDELINYLESRGSIAEDQQFCA
jgi:phosphatidylserine/phosphatidylglycerophosphate/cardiolipin synthase-like enzyme